MKNMARHDYSDYSDEKLMGLYQDGCNSAFDEIVNRFQNPLFFRMISHIQNKQDCEDLVQDTFLRVSRSRHSYSSKFKFSPWLFTIARNLLFTQYRKIKLMEVGYMNDEWTDNNILPDALLHQANLMASTRKAIGQLSPKFSDLLYLRMVQECNYNEIKEITGLPLGTIKSRIGRGRARLRKSLRIYSQE
ncbi:MAG: sigma-70 family RNA polymerase sigma factor [Balneolales bacterium]